MRKLVLAVLENSKALLFITAVLIGLGFISLATVRQAVFPSVNFPRATINVDSGFTPLSDMQTRFILPIEKLIAATPGITRTRVKVRRGSASFDIDFDPSRDYKAVFQEISTKVSALAANGGPNTSITAALQNSSSFSVLGYSLVSERPGTSDYLLLRTVVDEKIIPTLQSVPGVGSIEVIGGLTRQINIVMDPARLAQHAISPAELGRQIAAANTTRFMGTIVEYGKLVLGFSDASLDTIPKIESLPITVGAQTVPLSLLANVTYASDRPQNLTTTDRKKSVLFNVAMVPGADVIAVTRQVTATFDKLAKELPPGMVIRRWYALSDFIQTSINNVTMDIYIGVVIISLCILFYLRTLRASVPIIVAMGGSIMITFIFVQLLGYTLNIMTLAGISAAVGVLVDDAIVVVENITRHHSMGEDPQEAVVAGTAEVISPMFFSTLTRVAVFAPLGLLTGMSGFLFQATSVVIVIAMIVSMILAFTLSPILTRMMMRRGVQHDDSQRWGYRVYRRVLAMTLRAPLIVVVLAVAMVTSAGMAGRNLATSYLPVWDEGTFVMDLDTPTGTSMASMNQLIDGVEQVIASIPEIQTFSRQIADSALRTNQAHFFFHPKPTAAAGGSVFQVMDKLNAALVAKFPDLNIDLHQILPDQFDNFSGSQNALLVEVSANALSDVLTAEAQLTAAFKKLPEIQKVKAKIPESQRDFSIVPDDTKLAAAGLGRSDFLDQVKMALYGQVVNRITQGSRRLNLSLQYPRQWQNFRPTIGDIPIFNSAGKAFPLRAVARVETRPSPDVYYRQNGTMIVRINIETNSSNMGANAALLQSTIDKTPLPGGVTAVVGGDWKAQIKTFSELRNVLLIAVFLVFTLLLMAFRSYGHAALIMLNTGISLSFVVFGLLITGTVFNVPTFMGLIAAVGVVVNNGILIMAFLDARLQRGLSATEAMIDACVIRARPILITSAAAALGFAPMAIAAGRGGEMLQPFATAMIFGILGSIVSSLLVLPNLYQLGVVAKRRLTRS